MSVGSANSISEHAPHGEPAPGGRHREAARLHASFGRRLYEYSASEQTLHTLRAMMLAATDKPTYERRRAAFLRILRESKPTSGFVARILRYFAVDAPDLGFDDRDALVHAVLVHANDDEALVLFLLTMTDRADCVRPILDRLARGERAFEIIARLLTAPWLEPFRHILAAKLLEAACNRQGDFRVWVRDHPDWFFRPDIFELFFRRGHAALCGICKEILVDGPELHRARLIAQLENEGTESALRLLVLGLPFGGRPCEPTLLAAIASFNHELAVAALRDVVHCGNLQEEHTEDAIRAIRALHSMDNEESRDFLEEVEKRRCALLPAYRRELRRGAAGLRGERRDR